MHVYSKFFFTITLYFDKVYNAKKKFFAMLYRVIPSFRPRFASKCGRRQETNTIHQRLHFAVRPATNHPRSSCPTHTSDNIAQKYSMEKMNIFFPLPGIDLGYLSI